MENTVDVERLHRVLADHPWLAEALRQADWWIHEDGSFEFRTRVDDRVGIRAVIGALAEALGLEVNELPAGAEPIMSDPEHPPIRFEDLPRPSATAGTG